MTTVKGELRVPGSAAENWRAAAAGAVRGAKGADRAGLENGRGNVEPTGGATWCPRGVGSKRVDSHLSAKDPAQAVGEPPTSDF